MVPRTIHDQVNSDDSASSSTLGSGGSDTLPGFFGGRYAMVPLGFSYRQQIVQQAPKGFEWQVLPAPAGADGLTQGVSPQTLSVAEDSPHKEEAAEFIDFMLRPENMVRLALGDWMLPTGTQALKSPSLRTEKDGWATGTALATAPPLGPRPVGARLPGVEGQGRDARLPGVLQRGDRPRRAAKTPGGRRKPGAGALSALSRGSGRPRVEAGRASSQVEKSSCTRRIVSLTVGSP